MHTIRQVLDGHTGPDRDIVIVNAAAALWVADPALSLKECATIAAEAIDSGSAADKVIQMREWTNVKN